MRLFILIMRYRVK